jgi:hypothetical protein
MHVTYLVNIILLDLSACSYRSLDSRRYSDWLRAVLPMDRSSIPGSVKLFSPFCSDRIQR